MPERVAPSLDTLSILCAAPANYLVLLPDAPRFTIAAVTDAYLQVTFTRRDALLGKGLFEVFPDNPEWPKATGVANLRASLNSVLHTKREHRMDEQRYDVVNPREGEFAYKVWQPLNRPVLDEGGEVQYIIHYVEDITEKVKGCEQVKQREAAEAKARAFLESRQFMEQVMEATPDFISVFNLQTGKVEFINRSGYKEDEARYHETLLIDYEQILQRAHPDDRAGLHQYIENFRIVNDNDIRSFEYRVVRDRSILWYRSRGKVFARNASGAPTHYISILQDITEYKRAEQALQQSKALLQTIIDAPNIGMTVYKALRSERGEIIDFVHEYINRASVDMLGADFTGKLFTEHGENAIVQLPRFIEVIQAGKSNSYIREAHFRGRTVWFAITNTPLGDDRLVHTWEDVTERKQAEEQIRTTKESLQAILDGSLDFIQAFKAVRDEAGKIVDFRWVFTNHNWNKHYGDVIGKSLLKQNPAVIETGLFDKFVQVTETGVIIDHEHYYSHEQFYDQWFHQTLVKMGDGFVMNKEDITERKKAEAEILRLKDEVAQRATDKYYSLFNSIDEGLSVLELIYDDGGKPVDMRWVEVNPAFERITGLKNVAGRLCSDFVPSEQYWLDAYDSVIKTGEPLRYENYHAGINQWYRTHTSRIGGPESRMVANVFEDITERKQREQQQAYLLKLSDALRSISDASEIEKAVTAEALLHFQCDRCYYCTIEEGAVIIRRDAFRDGLPSIAGSYPLNEFDLFNVVLETGRPFVANDIHTSELVNEVLLSLLCRVDIQSFVNVPVVKAGKVAGVFTVAQNEPRTWSDMEIALAAETAERTWAEMERARAEEALRSAEEAYRLQLEEEVRQRTKELEEEHYFLEQVTDKTPHLIYVFDLDEQRFTYINKRVEQLVGRDQEYVYAMGPHLFQAIIHPADLARREAYMTSLATLNEQEIREHEFRIWTGNGFRWFCSKDSIFKKVDGIVKQVIGLAEDVTYEKMMQERMQREEGQRGLN